MTNLRTVATFYYFNVIDELNYVRQTQIPIPWVSSQHKIIDHWRIRLLWSFKKNPSRRWFNQNSTKNPIIYLPPLVPSVWIQGGQTVTVTVNLWIPATAVTGQRNKITFTARGVTDVQQAVFFTVGNQNSAQDTWAPWVSYTYGARCEWKSSPGVCSQHVWSVDVIAQDSDTGVMRLNSAPRGLLLRNAFTAGTREPVTATYSASCCQPKVTITVYDAANNFKSIELDVRDIWLSEAGIAAVVVGVLLFIALVILIVILCVWCIRRRRKTQELPIYRSRTRSRQERQGERVE